ncbi:MAG: hypothetical protein WC408_03375 [Candidatus Micrarchaeia archaeon]|jgi:hypothetical protein
MKLSPILIAVALLLVLPLAQAYTDHSLSVIVSVKKDGTAHVREKTIFYVDTDAEVQAFKDNLKLGKSTLIAWKKFSDNIRYHIGGIQSPVENLSITAGPEYDIKQNARSVTLDYDLVDRFVEGEKVGSRTTTFMLNEEILGFDKSETRQTILGSNVYFTIQIPTGATIIKKDGSPLIGPSPYIYDTTNRTITWMGPSTGKWLLGFEMEEPLSNEVYSFFSNAYTTAIGLVPLALLLISAAFIVTMLVKLRKA